MENKNKEGMKFTQSDDLLEIIENKHIVGSNKTSLKPDAFEIDDETKIEIIEKH
jgi:hypothetical protein